MGQAVFKCFFNRADLTFFIPLFINTIAKIIWIGIESLRKLFIVTDQPIVSVLNRNQTRHKLEQVLVFIPLFFKCNLLFSNSCAHLIYGSKQLAHFIVLINVHIV